MEERRRPQQLRINSFAVKSGDYLQTLFAGKAALSRNMVAALERVLLSRRKGRAVQVRWTDRYWCRLMCRRWWFAMQSRITRRHTSGCFTTLTPFTAIIMIIFYSRTEDVLVFWACQWYKPCLYFYGIRPHCYFRQEPCTQRCGRTTMNSMHEGKTLRYSQTFPCCYTDCLQQSGETLAYRWQMLVPFNMYVYFFS